MPSGVVGVLRINLVANSASFSADMQKARSSIKGFAEDSKADLRKYQNDAAKLFRETRTDAERYAASLERLKALHARGLDDSTFARASAKLRQEFSSQVPLMQRWEDRLRGMFTKQGTEDMPLLKAIGANLPELAGKAALFGGLAAAAGGAALAIKEMSDRWHEMMDIGKTSRMFGASLEGLIGLEEAFHKTGTASEELPVALARMERELGDAMGGDTGAAAKFKSLGLEYKKLAAMDPSEAFGKIAEAISKLPTAAERAAAAMGLFGRGGYQLLPVLNLGAEGLRKFHDEAKKEGKIFSEDDLAKVRSANIALREVGESFRIAFTSAVVAAAPAIQSLAESLVEVATELRHILQNTFVVDVIVGGFRLAAESVKAFVSVLTAAEISYLKLQLSMPDFMIAPLGGEKTGAQVRGESEKALKEAEIRMADLWDPGRTASSTSGNPLRKTGAPGVTPASALGGAKISQILEAERERLDTMQRFGVASDGVADKLAQLQQLGATEEQIASFKTMTEQIKELGKQSAAIDKLAEASKKLREDVANYVPGGPKTPTADALRKSFEEAGPAHDRSGLRERQELLRMAELKDTRDKFGGMYEQGLGPAEKLQRKWADIQAALKAKVFGEGPGAEKMAARAWEDARQSVLGKRPEENFSRNMRDLEELRPFLGEKEYEKRKRNFRREAVNEMTADDIRNHEVSAAPAMQAGSQQAYSAIVQSMMSDPKTQLQRDANAKLDQILTAVRANKPEPTNTEVWN